MQKASETLIAARDNMSNQVRKLSRKVRNVPQPRTPAMLMAPTMAHGTAVAAFDASSDM